MKVTVRVHGVSRPGFAAWAQALDQSSEEKVPFADGTKDVCLTRGTEDGIATLELPDGADLVVYEEKEANASEQDAYLRGQQA